MLKEKINRGDIMRVNDSEVINMFERAVSKFAGSKYGVAISSQTNAVFLSLELLKLKGLLKKGLVLEVPKYTYMSIPMTILNAGFKLKFRDEEWSGAYEIVNAETKEGIGVWDSAVRFRKDMYVPNSLYCVSFQYRKALPIGRGGMVLTDNIEYHDLLKKLCFNGRTNGVSQKEDKYTIRGWNMYMCPENASRGLTLMTLVADDKKDIASWKDYPDVSKQFTEVVMNEI